jgi:thioredoxin reductase
MHLVRLDDGDAITAKSVIIATGARVLYSQAISVIDSGESIAGAVISSRNSGENFRYPH